MCGIAGLLSRTSEHSDRLMLEQMMAAVAHRGPDGEGILVDGRVGFGHRRLAIIELSAAGAQPMRCAASGRTIVYNGEIYNYLELRAELQAGGYAFQSQSDTEVILAAYHRWGPSCVERFNGMWAFAIHDQAQQVVFCSRDRFGVKPFYYLDHPKCFAFGSEIRQLLPLLETRAATRDALVDYLTFADDERGTDTFFDGVRRLAPGHNLIYQVGNGGYSIRRYYRVQERDDLRRLSSDAAGTAVRELLTDSVRLRLRSDVPVGTCLSGGLDSSSIATLAAMLLRESQSQPLAAITAVPEKSPNDESSFAKMIVDQAGLTWRRVQPDFEAFNAALPEVVRAQEEPFSTPSVCMQFFVMQEAKRQGIPVLLDGQGGDETLLGYERYMVGALSELYAGSGLRSTLRAMRQLAAHNDKLGIGSQLKFLAYFSAPSLRWARTRRRLGAAPWVPDRAEFCRKLGAPAASMFEAQRREVESGTIPHLLRYEDKNSMWHSIETRLPFLDYRLVELSLNLATEVKIRDGWTKFALRKAVQDLLPAAVVWRTNKFAFEAPDSLWLPKLRSAMIAAVTSSNLLSTLYGGAPTKVDQLPQALVWRLYIVALWEREFEVTTVTDNPRADTVASVLNARHTHRICTRCVMDGSDPEIEFDHDGVCNHCRNFAASVRDKWFPNEEGAQRLTRILDEIKTAGKGKRYDSILGLSGGVDSSYLALKLHESGIRPLVVHVDAGWNSELAVANIERIVKYCDWDLHTHVVDWEEMRDLQLAYLRSGVANQDVPQDHVFFASLYHFAIKNNIKTIFSGGNIATEEIFPGSWEGGAMDARNLRAIHRRFGRQPLSTYRTISMLDYYVYFPFLRQMRTVRPLNYMAYNKAEAVKMLEATVGWRNYPRKHGESIFTKWYQDYYLPTRFGFDKRRPHLASMIASGQLGRDEALTKLDEPLFEPGELERDIEYITKKLRISRVEFDEFMTVPLRHYSEFDTQDALLRPLKILRHLYEGATGTSLRRYS